MTSGTITSGARISNARAAPNPFGELLREWRQHRRLSQLALAVEAEISQRHLSFLETGRAAPTPASIAKLSNALALPLREQNSLLRSAGFADAYAEEPLGTTNDSAFRGAIEAMISHHDPYPAVIIDGRWRLLHANDGARNLFGRFIDLERVLANPDTPTDFQLARLCLDDRGFRPFIANWSEVIEAMLRRARQALAANPRDAALRRFIDEIVSHPEAPATWREPSRAVPPQPVLTLDLERGEETYRLFTMLAHFGNPQSVTLEELAVELFYPADEATERLLRALG